MNKKCKFMVNSYPLTQFTLTNLPLFNFIWTILLYVSIREGKKSTESVVTVCLQAKKLTELRRSTGEITKKRGGIIDRELGKEEGFEENLCRRN